MNTIAIHSRSRAGGTGTVLLVVLGAILLAGIIFYAWFKGIYNNIVVRDEQINSAWSQVEVVLQRRFDLIPNLVNTVKGFAQQEQEVLTEVTRLRSQWGEAQTTEEKVGAANLLQGALGRLMVVVEKYPELKSNQNFLALQNQLEGTENRIAVERRRYNEAVQSYNAYIRQFPQTFIASLAGFEVNDNYFSATQGAEEAPAVAF